MIQRKSILAAKLLNSLEYLSVYQLRLGETLFSLLLFKSRSTAEILVQLPLSIQYIIYLVRRTCCEVYKNCMNLFLYIHNATAVFFCEDFP